MVEHISHDLTMFISIGPSVHRFIGQVRVAPNQDTTINESTIGLSISSDLCSPSHASDGRPDPRKGCICYSITNPVKWPSVARSKDQSNELVNAKRVSNLD